MDEGLSKTFSDAAQNIEQSAQEANKFLEKLINALQELTVKYGGRLIAAVLILIVGFKLVNLMMRKLARSKASDKLDPSARSVVHDVIAVVLKCIIIITSLAVMGIPMSSIVAVVGSCGLAIGLALQGSLANIAGGFILLVFKPFGVGDYISLSGVEGTVREIGIFQIKVETTDGKMIVIPNSSASNATLTNYTANAMRRVDLKFTASYNDDINKVESVLLEVCRRHPLVSEEPAPFARLSSHLDSALEYTVRVWCRSEDYWTVYYDLVKSVKYAFDENGISIPYPQLDVNGVSIVK